jgi:hypothetical protein
MKMAEGLGMLGKMLKLILLRKGLNRITAYQKVEKYLDEELECFRTDQNLTKKV